MTDLPIDPILVTTNEQLNDCIAQLKGCEAIALDTEFMRTDTFYPILGLIQVFNGDSCWLIDPLAVTDLTAFAEILVAPEITKVFHSCSEDLDVLKHVMGCVPKPLFDTQIAAALTGYGFSKGYAGLVEAILGIHVPKGETRSDWLQRPLREAQLGYAASDVIHLFPVYQRICDNLKELGRQSWMEQEMAELVRKASEPVVISDYFLKVKGAWQLDSAGLAALQLLCEWRETEARERNRPRGRVLSDKTLLELVLKNPSNRRELSDIEGMHPGIIRRYADTLMSLLQRDVETPSGDSPVCLPEPLPREAGALIKQLKKVVTGCSEKLDLPPEVLARKRDLEVLVRYLMAGEAVKLPESLAMGWRYDVVGKALQQAANNLR